MINSNVIIILTLILLLETLNVVITNDNTGRIPQFQALPQGKNELNGVMCEEGNIILNS